MVSLTPELAGNTLTFTLIYAILGFGITVYSVYLNWKQAKVNAQMGKLIEEVRKIRMLIENNH